MTGFDQVYNVAPFVTKIPDIQCIYNLYSTCIMKHHTIILQEKLDSPVFQEIYQSYVLSPGRQETRGREDPMDDLG
jgi:hypothetical protein